MPNCSATSSRSISETFSFRTGLFPKTVSFRTGLFPNQSFSQPVSFRNILWQDCGRPLQPCGNCRSAAGEPLRAVLAENRSAPWLCPPVVPPGCVPVVRCGRLFEGKQSLRPNRFGGVSEATYGNWGQASGNAGITSFLSSSIERSQRGLSSQSWAMARSVPMPPVSFSIS